MKEVQSWVCMSAWESHRPFYVPDAFLAMLLCLDSKPVSDTFGSLREIRVCVWHAYRMAAGLLTQCTAAECLLCSRDWYHSNEHEIQPLTNSQQLQKVIWSCHLEDVENTAVGTITTHKSLAAAEQCHNSGTKRRGKALPRPGTYLRAFPWALLCLLVACQRAASGKAWEGLQIRLRPWETGFRGARWGRLLLLSDPTARPGLSGSELVWEEGQHAQASCQCRLRWNQSRCWREPQRQRNPSYTRLGAPSVLNRELWSPAGEGRGYELTRKQNLTLIMLLKFSIISKITSILLLMIHFNYYFKSLWFFFWQLNYISTLKCPIIAIWLFPYLKRITESRVLRIQHFLSWWGFHSKPS